MKKALLPSLICLASTSLFTQAAWAADAVIYKKMLPQGEVTVTKRDFPIVETDADKKMRENYRKERPGGDLIMALNGYEYSFFLSKASSRRKLWSFKTSSFQPYTPELPTVLIYDVSLQQNKLIVVYKDEPQFLGSVVSILSSGSAVPQPRSMKDIPLRPDEAFAKRFRFTDNTVYSAAITGSLSKGDLTVVVDKVYPSARAFHWKNNKWVYEDISNQPIMQKPVTINGKKWLLELTQRINVTHSVKNYGETQFHDMTGYELRLVRKPLVLSSSQPSSTGVTSSVGGKPKNPAASLNKNATPPAPQEQLLWAVFFNDSLFGQPNERWLADAYVDEAENKIYLALNYERHVWVQVLDANTTVKTVAVNFQGQPFVSAARQFLDDYDLPPWVLRTENDMPDTLLQNLPYMRSIHIEKAKGDLFLTLSGSKSPIDVEQSFRTESLRWIYNTKEKVWRITAIKPTTPVLGQ